MEVIRVYYERLDYKSIGITSIKRELAPRLEAKNHVYLSLERALGGLGGPK